MNDPSGNILVPPQEFLEERERQLPPDTRALTADMARVAKHADSASQTPLGEPSLDFTVRAVYDSRFPNTQDFNIAVEHVGESGDESFVILSFQVPQGMVCVLRELHHWFETTVPFVQRSDVLMSLQINNVNVQYNQNIPVGVESDVLVKSFVIADENQTVGIRLDFSSALTDPTVWALFYGNFIAKTGRALAFEIANPGIAGPVNVAPFMPPPPPPPPAQVPAFVPPAAPIAPPSVTPAAVIASPAPLKRVKFAKPRIGRAVSS